jgi:hypothetical protein
MGTARTNNSATSTISATSTTSATFIPRSNTTTRNANIEGQSLQLNDLSMKNSRITKLH